MIYKYTTFYQRFYTLSENPVVAGDRQEPKLEKIRFSHKNEEQLTIITSNLTL